ncbi:MAG: NAD(P)-binding protein [bacterium]
MSDHKPIVYKNCEDVPAVVMSEASMLWNKTGAWRYIKPKYCDKVPSCNQGCPAGNDVENFVRLAEEKKYKEAWLSIKEENPFPRVCGRVCYYPCETACNRGQFDRAVSINALERFIGDYVSTDTKIERLQNDSGKKVAVVGSGPAGLTTAYHLARLGHGVHVYEADEKPGGVLRYGIPEYRLPKKVLDEEIQDIINLGVTIDCNKKVGETIQWEALLDFDAVFVATGAHKSRNVGIENEEAQGVMPGLGFLKKVAQGKKVHLGPRTVVVGGGNTAIDAARTAMRLGSQVTIHYYRSRNEIPAFKEEVDEAQKEGVHFDMLSEPVRVLVDGDKATGIEMRRTRLGDPDESGRRRPVSVEGSEYSVDATTIIIAIGEDTDLEYLPSEIQEERGRVIVDAFGATSRPGVFAGGDMAIANHNVAYAIGSGKAAAIAIDAYLKGSHVSDIVAQTTIGEYGAMSMSHYIEAGRAHAKNRYTKSVVSYNDINLNYFEEQERSKQTKLELSERHQNFKEVHQGLSEDQIQNDAQRCFHCGVCTMCDTCYIYCPDIAIEHKGDAAWGYDINFDYCKGCGICVHECPRNAMMMEDE